MSSRRSSDTAWLTLAVWVLAYDAWACHVGSETMSQRFRRSPKAFTWPLCGYVLAHLVGVVPERLDPLCRLGRVVSVRQ